MDSIFIKNRTYTTHSSNVFTKATVILYRKNIGMKAQGKKHRPA